MPEATVPIIVVSTVDANYLPLVEIVALSIADSATSGREVHYHVLYDGTPNRDSRLLDGWRRGPVAVHIHPIDNEWRRFGLINSFPPSALIRLSLPQLLPQFKRVIYLDVDIVVQADLGPLFDVDLDEYAIAAARDRLTTEDEGDRDHAAFRVYTRDVLGLGDDWDRYGQAGVLVMDLPKLRDMDYARRAADVLERFGQQLRYADQCAMNVVLRGEYRVLDPRWNVSPELFERYPKPWLIHFAFRKPWRALRLAGGGRWWRHALKAGRAGEFALRLVRERTRLELIRLRHLLGLRSGTY